MARDPRSVYETVGRPRLTPGKLAVRSYKYVNPVKKLVEEGYSISMACKKAGICRQFYYVTSTEEQRKEVKELRKKIVKQKLHW